MSDQENKSLDYLALGFELKQLGVNEADGTIEGIASARRRAPDSHGEIIAKGAFAESLKVRGPDVEGGPNVRFLWEHRIGEIIGTILELRETARGLYFKAKLTLGVQRGAEAYALLKDGAIDAVSIGFNIVDSNYNADTGVRTITEVRLFEISIVGFPADDKALITGVKSDNKIQDVEKALRDVVGFSRSESKVAAKAAMLALNLRDAGEVKKEGFWDAPELRDALRKANEQSNLAVKSDGGTRSALQAALAKTRA